MPYEGDLSPQVVGTACAIKQSPMERAIHKVDEQFKMLEEDLSNLGSKLQGVSSSKPCSPSTDCPKKSESFAPIVEITNVWGDRLQGIRARIRTMVECLDI